MGYQTGGLCKVITREQEVKDRLGGGSVGEEAVPFLPVLHTSQAGNGPARPWTNPERTRSPMDSKVCISEVFFIISLYTPYTMKYFCLIGRQCFEIIYPPHFYYSKTYVHMQIKACDQHDIFTSLIPEWFNSNQKQRKWLYMVSRTVTGLRFYPIGKQVGYVPSH